MNKMAPHVARLIYLLPRPSKTMWFWGTNILTVVNIQKRLSLFKPSTTIRVWIFVVFLPSGIFAYGLVL
jgi:hypothetical protein